MSWFLLFHLTEPRINKPPVAVVSPKFQEIFLPTSSTIIDGSRECLPSSFLYSTGFPFFWSVLNTPQILVVPLKRALTMTRLCRGTGRRSKVPCGRRRSRPTPWSSPWPASCQGTIRSGAAAPQMALQHPRRWIHCRRIKIQAFHVKRFYSWLYQCPPQFDSHRFWWSSKFNTGYSLCQQSQRLPASGQRWPQPGWTPASIGAFLI